MDTAFNTGTPPFNFLSNQQTVRNNESMREMEDSDEKGGATLSIKKGVTAVALGYRNRERPASPLNTRFRIADTHPSVPSTIGS